MSKASQREKAKRLRDLHTCGKLLILPNVWNPIGARVLEAKGFPAVATASAAIAESLGYRDGEHLAFDTMLDMIGRIARSVEVPVTADIESGYADSVSVLKDSIRQVMKNGVVGINIEDSLEEGVALRPVEEQCERLHAVREVSGRMNIHLVINARVDCYLSDGCGVPEEKLEASIVRAHAYSNAGADCVYVIGPNDSNTIAALRKRIEAPLNILASPGSISLKELECIGVNRVSFGPFVFRSCLKRFVDIASGIGDCDMGWTEDMLSGHESAEFLSGDAE